MGEQRRCDGAPLRQLGSSESLPHAVRRSQEAGSAEQQNRTRLIIIPGIHGSDKQHWQTLWERADRSAIRIQPSDWDRPALDDWLAALDAAIASAPSPAILVAHSLGCLLAVFWDQRTPAQNKVKGAFLVAPPDPLGPNFPAQAPTFRDPPRSTLHLPSLLVASSDDPYCSIARARTLAAEWGSDLRDVGPCGHLNSLSGLKSWPQGRQYLEQFCAEFGVHMTATLP